MWYKRLVNYYVLILCILTVNLLSDKLTAWIFGFRFMTHPAKATIIGIVVLVFMLYPAYHYLDALSERTALRIFRIGKNAGGKFIGVTLSFLVCLFVLYLFYIQLWFGTDVFIEQVTAGFRVLLNYLKGK